MSVGVFIDFYYVCAILLFHSDSEDRVHWKQLHLLAGYLSLGGSHLITCLTDFPVWSKKIDASDPLNK